MIEEDAPRQDRASAVLAAEGWPVVAARSGEEALARFPGTRIRLVLLDLDLSGPAGLEIVPLLRGALPGGRDLPILAHAAPVSEGIEDRSRAAGIDAFLARPCSPQALVAAVARLLHGPLDAPRRLMELFGERRFGDFLRGLDAQLASAPQQLAGPEREPYLHRLGGLAGTLGFAPLSHACLAFAGRADSAAAALARPIAETRAQIRTLLASSGNR